MKAFLNWSGGKDSALAFYLAGQQGIAVELLVTTVARATARVTMHGVRRQLLEKQAAAMNMKLLVVELPDGPGIEAYETAVRNTQQQLAADGFTHAVFGDIFLEDLKSYRETLLAKDGLAGLFPLWQMQSAAVMQAFFSVGFEGVVVCTDSVRLGKAYCGRLLNQAFVNALPPNVDPCGENGEYHSFVFNGPVFTSPVAFRLGDVVYTEYPAPRQDSRRTAPQLPAGFYFQDLLP